MAGTAFLSSASLLVGLQLVSRLFTFVLNQALLRFVSPQAFGTAAIQFELLSSTILFLSREGFRNALLRAWRAHSSNDDDGKGDRVVPRSVSNLSLLPIFIGAPVTVLASAIYRASCSPDTRGQPGFDSAVVIYAFSAIIELLSEPMHIRTMGELRTAVRVKAEGTGIITKTITIFLVLLYDHQRGSGQLPLVAFAAGQLAYASTVLAVYLGYEKVSFSLRRVQQKEIDVVAGYFDRTYLRLALSMTGQSLFKHLLTEGDKFLVSRFSPLRDQGGYALATNYGSLVARILFQPIEEMSRVFFSQTLAENSTSRASTPVTVRRSNLTNAADVLQSIISVQVTASLLLISLGPPNLPILVRLALPTQYLYTSAPQLLGAWVYYIPILAINGLLEAFVTSVSTPLDVNRQSRWMALFSMIFVVVTGGFYSFGFQDLSLIYANIVNLSVRIVYASVFVTSYFTTRGARDVLRWRKMAVSTSTCLAIAATATISRYTVRNSDVQRVLKTGRGFAILNSAVLSHVTIDAVLGLLCLGMWWRQSGRYLSLPRNR